MSLPLSRFLLFTLGLSLAASGADVPTIPPVDDSPGYPAFQLFYRKFQRAVEDRDGAFLLSVIDDGIKIDFGGGEGREEFVTRWKPDQKDSPLWLELDRILALGGALAKGEGDTVFTAPHAFAKWPDAYDPFEYVFVAGRDVNFRKEGGEDKPVLRAVSWEIMKVVEQSEGDWVKLRAEDGVIGYIHKDYARSSIDYRIGFEGDAKGGFRMTFLLAGD